MALEPKDIQATLESKCGEFVSDFRMEEDILTFEVKKDAVKDVIRFMHKNDHLSFNFLTDLCGIHYPQNEKGRTFAVVYLLHNWVDNVRVRVKAYLDADAEEIDSITEVFASANWMERETYDFFGIRFAEHPNLRRILNVDDMTSFPMRKEFPMEDPYRTDKDDRFFGRDQHNYQPEQK